MHGLRTIRRVSAQMKKQSISMQRKFMLYLLTVALAVIAFLVLILSIMGVFNRDAQKIHDSLELQLQNVQVQISQHRDALEGQCISLSQQLTDVLTENLTAHGLTVKDLNDNPQLLKKIQRAMFGKVRDTLKLSQCSGAFVILDATTNTSSDKASHSASGFYLRYANLNAKDAAVQDVVCFRGIPDVARDAQVELHNRWNLEFDTDLLPGYHSLLHSRVNRLADAYRWTDRFRLPDTWEDVSLLYMPVLDKKGTVCGICGVELSALYSYPSYPAMESPYGPMITILAPVTDGQILIGRGLTGGLDGTFLGESSVLSMRRGKRYNHYMGSTENYIGLQTESKVRGPEGAELAAAVLMPETNVAVHQNKTRLRWILGSFTTLAALYLLTRWLSTRFVSPIVSTLQTIRQDGDLQECSQTGISELDQLMDFVSVRAQQKNISVGSLPPNIEELFHSFSQRAEALSSAERGILKFYIDGYEITQVPELACISIHTVKKHNSSIYQKLGVASRDELMLYIELFRRCDRLHELVAPDGEAAEMQKLPEA